MARSGSRASAVTQECVLTPERADCTTCGQRLWIAYHEHRRVVRLDGVWGLTLRVRRCRNRDCAASHQAYAPEEAGAWALPHAEFGLDVLRMSSPSLASCATGSSAACRKSIRPCGRAESRSPSAV